MSLDEIKLVDGSVIELARGGSGPLRGEITGLMERMRETAETLDDLGTVVHLGPVSKQTGPCMDLLRSKLLAALATSDPHSPVDTTGILGRHGLAGLGFGLASPT